jgi:hypothetical protein
VGLLDDIAIEDIRRFEAGLYDYLDTAEPRLVQAIREKRILDDDLKNRLKTVIDEFKKQFLGAPPESKSATSPGHAVPVNGYPAAAKSEQSAGKTEVVEPQEAVGSNKGV